MAAIFKIPIPSKPSCRNRFENLFLLLICTRPPFWVSPSPSDHHVDRDLSIYSYFSSIQGCHFENHHPCRSSCRHRFENLFLFLICTWPPFWESPSPADHHVDINLRIYSYFSSVQYGRHFWESPSPANHHVRVHRFENLFLLLIFYLIGRHFENHQPLQTIMLDMDLRVHSYFSSVPWPPFLRITFPSRSSCRHCFENLFFLRITIPCRPSRR